MSLNENIYLSYLDLIFIKRTVCSIRIISSQKANTGRPTKVRQVLKQSLQLDCTMEISLMRCLCVESVVLMVSSARADVDWGLANCVITWCHADHVPRRHIVMTALASEELVFKHRDLRLAGGAQCQCQWCAGSFESMPVILEFTPPSIRHLAQGDFHNTKRSV